MGFQNARGITRGDNPAEEVLEAASDYQLSLFGIAESNCEWNKELETAVTAATRKRFGNGFITCASTSRKNHGYLPGGVMQLARGNICGRKTSKGTDKYGRYSWMKFDGKNEQKLIIVTAYRVTQKKGTPQTPNCNTAYWQQVQAMIKDGKVDPDPRTQILTDLSRFMNGQRAEGYEVFLMIDANDDWEETNSPLKKFMEDNLLNDVHHTVVDAMPATTRIGSSW